jgi:protein phosphatase
MLDLEFTQLTDVGLVRDHNEDAIGHALPPSPEHARDIGWLFVLADGVGGHDRGEVASSMAVETVLQDFRRAKPNDSVTAMLPKAIEHANLRIYEAAMSTGPGGSSMATTVVACALRYDRATIAHVGDSRCYLLRHGRAASLTRDHTMAAEQLRMGLITAREATGSQTSHVLSRSVGAALFVNVDTTEQQVFANDILLLCSDGLHNSVGNDDIVRLIEPERPLDDSAAALIALAKERDGGDNISVQIIRVREVERVGMYRGRHYKLR